MRRALWLIAPIHRGATADGVIGTIDTAKMEAIGDYLLGAGILKDANGDVITMRPDFAAYYTDTFVAAD